MKPHITKMRDIRSIAFTLFWRLLFLISTVCMLYPLLGNLCLFASPFLTFFLPAPTPSLKAQRSTPAPGSLEPFLLIIIGYSSSSLYLGLTPPSIIFYRLPVKSLGARLWVPNTGYIICSLYKYLLVKTYRIIDVILIYQLVKRYYEKIIIRRISNKLCLPITFHNPLKACFSNKKYILQSKRTLNKL